MTNEANLVINAREAELIYEALRAFKFDTSRKLSFEERRELGKLESKIFGAQKACEK